MFRFHPHSCVIAACGLAAFGASAVHASVSTADTVVQYTPGGAVPSSYWDEPYSDYESTAPLGLPGAAINLAENDDEGIYPDDTYVTPFNGQYNPPYITAIGGDGGYIELHMSQPVSTDGFTLGIHSGWALEDSSYPQGINSDPASTYSNDRSASLLVSDDGTQWVPVGTFDFSNPTNIYTDISGPYPETPGSQLANFAQPFLGDLSDFNGLDFPGTLAVLNGSAGGTWIDLSGTGLSQVDYVAFETDDTQVMYLDSVVGIAVPEPTSLALLLVPICFHRRR